MEPFKADPVDWEVIESESERMAEAATIRELRDRVVALELFGGLSRLDFIQKVLEEGVSADIRGGLSRLDFIQKVLKEGVSATILELRDRVAALEAPAAATTPPPAEPPDDHQTLHTEALAMVDSLERSFHLLPQILDTLRRAIREPMVADGGPLATDEEIAAAANQCLTPVVARRAIYNLGRQHATPTCPHIRQGDGDLAQWLAAHAPLPPLEVGQKWRRRDGKIVEVERCVGLTTNGCTTGWAGKVDDWWYIGDHKFGGDKTQPHAYDLIELVSPAPAPVKSPQAADESLKPLWQIMREAEELELKDNPMAKLAEVYQIMLYAAADWCEARTDTIGDGSDWAEMLRQEAGR
jgi:hypothetical protein